MHSEKSGIKGRKAYNNGVKVIYLTEDQEIPEGFVKGGLAFKSHEQYKLEGKKSSETQKLNWQLKSEEYKFNWKNKCVEVSKNIPVQKRQDMINKSKYTYSLKSTEEKLEINNKRSESCKNYWKFLSLDKKQSFLNKISNTCKEKYGVPYYCMSKDCRKYSSNNSKPNLKFASILDTYNICYESEFILDNKSFDFKIGDILIEIDPIMTHNTTINIFNRKSPIDRNYHFDKSKIAREHGYRCIHIFDWDDINKIIKLLVIRETIYARKCIIKEVPIDNAIDFINKYHIQSYARDSIRLGLYYNNDLVSIMTFGKPRYNKNYEYELIRYCSNKNVIGGAKKLFKYFLDNYKPKSIISYCDNNKFIGNLYSKLGFIYLNTKVSKHWYNPKTHQHILDSLLRQRGFDQLLGKQFGFYGKGSSNKDLMIQHGFLELYDAGQSTYIYNC